MLCLYGRVDFVDYNVNVVISIVKHKKLAIRTF